MQHNLVPIIYHFLSKSQYFVKVLKPFIFIIASTVAVDCFYFTCNFKLFVLRTYIPSFFSHLYALTINILYLEGIRHFEQVLESETYKSLFTLNTNDITISTKVTLNSCIQRTKFIFLIQIFCSTFGCSVNVIYGILKKSHLFIIDLLLEEYLPKGTSIHFMYNILFILGNVVSLISSILFPAYFVYILFNMKVKMIMLIDYTYRLKNKLEEERFIRSNQKTDNNNKYVLTCLKCIVLKHLEIKRYYIDVIEPYQYLFMFYIGAGVIVGLWSVSALFSPFHMVFYAIATGIAFAVFGFTLCNVPQELEDLSFDFALSVYDLYWFNWNSQCQKTYLVLLTNSLNGMQLPIFSMFFINHDLMKRVCRILYTFGSSLYSLQY